MFSKRESYQKGGISLLEKSLRKQGFFFFMTDDENYLHRLTKRFLVIDISITQHRFQRKILYKNLISRED